MEETLKNILEELKSLNSRVSNIEEGQQRIQCELKIGLEVVNKKLDNISTQVAHNTEQEVKLNNVCAIVEDHTTDIKLIKKIASNQ